MAEPTELLTCPFCSGVAHIADDLITFYGECGTCGATSGYSSYRAGAVANWNRRTPTPQPTQAQAGAITPPPIECDTEDLKRAYAFGWWSALEKQRETTQAGAVPLADYKAYALIDSMGWSLDDQEKDDMLRLLRATEAEHGIKGGRP